MSRPRSFARLHGIDVLVVLTAIAAVVQVTLLRDTPASSRSPLWLTGSAVGLMVLALLGRRRFPFAAPAGLWLLAGVFSFFDGHAPYPITVEIAGLVASFMLGNLRDVAQRRIGLAIVLASSAMVVYNSPRPTSGEIVFIPALFGLAWLAGFAVRQRIGQTEVAEQRAVQAERERETAARLAVAEERARIARELHDVVAHSVSVMVLQVGAVRHRLPPSLQEDREALQGVEHAGRTALTEMRRLLGAMRSEGEDPELAPQPGLDNLDSLLAEVTRAGLPARLHVEGVRFELPRGIDLSAYRIVQEGLTNALKHAKATEAEVNLQYLPDELRIEVRDNGRGASDGNGSGHGLVGIRERVKIYGGEMSAGAGPQGGFLLRTTLPVRGESQ